MRDQLHAQPVRTLALTRALTQASIIAVAAGKEHSLALTNTGMVYSWGGGKEGQLGNGDDETCQLIPRRILKFHSIRVTMVCAGGDHSVAVSEGGVVYSWGRGANGRLGHGDTQNFSSPTPVKALAGLYLQLLHCRLATPLCVYFPDTHKKCHNGRMWMVAFYGGLCEDQ